MLGFLQRIFILCGFVDVLLVNESVCVYVCVCVGVGGGVEWDKHVFVCGCECG